MSSIASLRDLRVVELGFKLRTRVLLSIDLTKTISRRRERTKRRTIRKWFETYPKLIENFQAKLARAYCETFPERQDYAEKDARTNSESASANAQFGNKGFTGGEIGRAHV